MLEDMIRLARPEEYAKKQKLYDRTHCLKSFKEWRESKGETITVKKKGNVSEKRILEILDIIYMENLKDSVIVIADRLKSITNGLCVVFKNQ